MKRLMIAMPIFLLIISGCSKKTTELKSTYLATVYKNTLSVPIYMHYVYSSDYQSKKEFIAAGDSIKFISLKNYYGENSPSNIYVIILSAKIYIGDKVKTDYNCSEISDAAAKEYCKKDIVSIFNQQRWIETRKKDTLIKTYNIDKADSLEAK